MSEHTPTKTPPRRRRAPTKVAGHQLLRPLEGSHATWEIPSDDPARIQLLVLGRARKGQESASRITFHRQLRARASLLHPHLASIVDGGESPRGPYVVVSLPRARPLSGLIAEGPMDPARTHRLLTGVADALDAAHTRWLIHTDLTPRALFVEPGPRDWAWLTDFGIAHNRPQLAFARAGYRSPEELRGEPPVPESNVYSLACIVYACLSGAAPFARPSSRAAMQAQLHEDPPKLAKVRPELPPAIDAVLASALAKTPDKRTKSAGALVRDVGEALGVVDMDANRRKGSGRFRRRPPQPTRVPVRNQVPVALNGAQPHTPVLPLPVPGPARRAPAAEPALPTSPLETLPPRGRMHSGRGRKAPAAVLLAALVVAVAGAGFAGWSLGSGDTSSQPQVDAGTLKAERQARARAKAAATAEQERVAWLGSANDAMTALAAGRATGRRRLSSASTPGDQAAAATRLSRSYAGARRAVGNPPASVPRAAAAASALRRAENAYDRLGRSARNGNRAAYRRAVASVRAAERDLDATLRRLGEPG